MHIHDLCVVAPLLYSGLMDFLINRCNCFVFDLRDSMNTFLILTLVRTALTGDLSPLFTVCFSLRTGRSCWQSLSGRRVLSSTI